MFAFFDKALNGVTMYKGVMFGLITILVAGGVLSALGYVGIEPLGLVVSTLTLAASCYVANRLFAYIFKAPYNSESWLITALILACIVAPNTEADFIAYAALAGVIAMASKYIITWRGSHVLNPAAVGAFVVSVAGLVSVNWWVATPWMTPVVLVIALVALRKQRKFTVFVVFAFTAIATMLVVNISQDQAISEVLKAAVLSWPIIFLGSIMLTEPTTLPSGRYNQVLIAVVVGAIFASQQHIGPVHSTPQLALLVGNVVGIFLLPPFGALLHVTRITKLSEHNYELQFNRPKRFHFTPGQYMEWTLPHSGVDMRGNRRTFSIASAPGDSEVRMAVRTHEKGSSYKRALTKLKVGDQMRVANISGEFVLPPGDSPLLLIAGGIGITPFRSMIADQIARKQKRDVELMYMAHEGEFIYQDVFELARVYGVKTHYLSGRLTEDRLNNKVPEVALREVYISGPPAMVDAAEKIVRGLGGSRVHKDHFSGY